MIKGLFFWLLLNNCGGFLLLFFLERKVYTKKRKDAFWRFRFLIEEADAYLRTSVEQEMQYFREVVFDRYEIVERNDFRI